MQSSIEDELNRESSADIPTVILSYLLMFLYASLALGKIKFDRRYPLATLVHTKFALGMAGILIVIASVSASVGLLSYCNLKATLIIAEVIPFLVLAVCVRSGKVRRHDMPLAHASSSSLISPQVGVDNIFILVNTFERITAQESAEHAVLLPVEERIAMTLSRVGPSVLLSSLSETIAFGLGFVVTMPAVSIFSMYAAVAVFIDFLLQITCFVALMTMDARRRERGGVDCWPWMTAQMPARREFPRFHQAALVVGESKEAGDASAAASTAVSPSRLEGAYRGQPLLERLFNQYYAPFILHRAVRPFVVAAFLALFTAGLLLSQQVELGLDQRIALPTGSYMINYFDQLERHLEVGPPLYLVVLNPGKAAADGKLWDFHETRHQQRICGKFLDCREDSIGAVLETEYLRNVEAAGRDDVALSTMATPTANWFDDFILHSRAERSRSAAMCAYMW